jgi:hypothetical protein
MTDHKHHLVPAVAPSVGATMTADIYQQGECVLCLVCLPCWLHPL